MARFYIGGMTCAACSARVEKAVSSLVGVDECSVNLLTKLMEVKGTASNEELIKAVEKAGYTAVIYNGNLKKENIKTTDDAKYLHKRVLYSLIFLSALMYVSMGHTMWGWYLPEYLSSNPVAIALLQFILSLCVLVINRSFFIGGFKALVNKSPNMDTLVALGSGASFIYSVYSVFAMSHSLVNGDILHAGHYLHELYFESSAMILTLISVGKILENRSKGKTTSALNNLINLAPKKAVVINDNTESVIDATELKIGDIIAVRPGESFAADGVIVEGEGSVDESSLTGEGIPVDKNVGDYVSAATVNRFGFLKVRVTSVGEDTTLSKIIKMVSDASATKAPIAKIADKVSGIFVPVVIAISFITTLVWYFFGADIGFCLSRGISVLVISCPCALGIATPVAIMVSSGIGAKNGILFKTATALENLGKTDVVVFDKTGTITKGVPEVTDIIVVGAENKNELLSLAYSLERKSEHPLSRAITTKAQQNDIQVKDISDFKVIPGNGLCGKYKNTMLYGGSLNFIKNYATADNTIQKINDELSLQGKTPMYFASDSNILGIIAVSDNIKEDSIAAVERLHTMGIKTVMLTGDNQLTANHIAKKVGISTVIAGVLPDGKAKAVENLRYNSFVTMVGDGINDAPSLACADMGIAVSNGTDIAIDAAQIVLLKESVLGVPAAITLSRLCLRNIKQNLFWAFAYNTLGIPLAAGVFIHLFGWKLNPMFGAAAMSLSSFCVISNALRLNLAKIYSKNIKKIKHKKGEKTMEKIFKIEGMMCPHCEARVKQLLEEIDGIKSVETSHKEGTAVITYTKDVHDDYIINAITDAGYKVL